jgi:hypothetical protein
MKRAAREVVRCKYQDALSPPEFEGGNQLHEYDMIKDEVAGILKDGIFLRGGLDENVRSLFLFAFDLTIFSRAKPRISDTQL